MKQKKQESLHMRLRLARLEKGYSQEDVAKRIGVKSRATIAKYESLRIPPMETLERLAGIYSVPTSYLLYGHATCTESEKPTGKEFRIIGRPKVRTAVQLYPHTATQVRAIARDNGISVAELLDQIVIYTLKCMPAYRTTNSQGGTDE